MNWLIILAGGNGERMKLTFNKIFIEINDHPLIYWTINSFEKSEVIGKIIISVRAEEKNELEKLIKKYHFKKIIKILEADHSRQLSTLKILHWLSSKASETDLVGIHNAVNPFVEDKEIEKVYEAAKKFGASLLAYPARDTIKISNKYLFIDHTPVRKNCWHAQTPQVASFGKLMKSFLRAERERFLGTDDTQLLERLGVKIKIVQCSNLNFKITFPEDLILAKKILKV